MIKVAVKPRQDDLYDIYVGDEGDHFLNSNQGYANVEDAERIVHRLWPGLPTADDAYYTSILGLGYIPREHVTAILESLKAEPVVLVVTYRDGKTKTEQIR